MCLIVVHQAGKEAMLLGVGEFNKRASLIYSGLDRKEKERLASIENKSMVQMSSKEIKKAAGKTFAKIRNMV